MEYNDFAEIAFEYKVAMITFEDKLLDITEWEDFGRLGFDSYDLSIEIYDVPNTNRLSDKAQEFIYNSGFRKCYLNHINGWETHYTLDNGCCCSFTPVEGWRVKYASKNDDISTTQIEKPIPEWRGVINHVIVKKQNN